MKEIDDAFSKSSKILLGHGLGNISDYGEWLVKDQIDFEMVDSSTSKKKLVLPTHSIFAFIPKNRMADLDSFEELSSRKIKLDSTDTLSSISKKMGGISNFVIEFSEGTNINVKDSTIYCSLSNAYKVADCFYCKYIAYNFFTDDNEYTFGTSQTFDSKFCIRAFRSRRITLGFEVDSCRDCSNVMFCHNCENLENAIFCSNVKGLRYAVGNVEVGKEKFLQIKSELQKKIASELEKDKKLALSIFSLGCRK